jgi:thioredoxin 1
MSSSYIKNITDENFDEEALKSKIPVIIDFWAEWCGPCKMLSPILDKIAEEYKDKIKICKVNVDSSPQIAVKYSISNIPTLFFIKNGNISDQHVGLLSEKALKEKIENFIK